MRNTVRAAAAALALVAAVACGDDGADTGSPSASDTGAVVEIKGLESLKFDKESLTATNGQEFKGRLTQQGAVPHNIEIKDFGVKGTDTMTTKAGESKEFSFTPDKTGSFEYVCTLHPGTMKGTLTVS